MIIDDQNATKKLFNHAQPNKRQRNPPFKKYKKKKKIEIPVCGDTRRPTFRHENSRLPEARKHTSSPNRKSAKPPINPLLERTGNDQYMQKPDCSHKYLTRLNRHQRTV
jgi:hypothetical protein